MEIEDRGSWVVYRCKTDAEGTPLGQKSRYALPLVEDQVSPSVVAACRHELLKNEGGRRSRVLRRWCCIALESLLLKLDFIRRYRSPLVWLGKERLGVGGIWNKEKGGRGKEVGLEFLTFFFILTFTFFQRKKRNEKMMSTIEI